MPKRRNFVKSAHTGSIVWMSVEEKAEWSWVEKWRERRQGFCLLKQGEEWDDDDWEIPREAHDDRRTLKKLKRCCVSFLSTRNERWNEGRQKNGKLAVIYFENNDTWILHFS